VDIHSLAEKKNIRMIITKISPMIYSISISYIICAIIFYLTTFMMAEAFFVKLLSRGHSILGNNNWGDSAGGFGGRANFGESG